MTDDVFDLTIVVPCLNEEKRIAATLETIRQTMAELPYRYEVLVIDDGCTDGTAAVVNDYIRAHPEICVTLHKNKKNLGLATSYVNGSFWGRGKYYKLVCGDNVESKDALIAVFSRLGQADIVIPYLGTLEGKSALRIWISNLYTFLVNLISGYRIRYYNGGALHLRFNVMRWGPYSFGFGFQAELITRLLDEGATYVEVPFSARHVDKHDITNALNWRNFLSVAHTLSELLIRRIRRKAIGH